MSGVRIPPRSPQNKEQAINSQIKQLIEQYGGDIVALKADIDNYVKPKNHNKAPLNTEVLVTISDLQKTYKLGKNKVEALVNVNIKIHAGEIVALVGPSGSGKSTLLNIISGLDKPTTGSVVVDSIDISNMSEASLTQYRSKTLGFVFQFFYLQPFLSLHNNVVVPAMFAGVSNNERDTKANELLDLIGLSDRANHLPKELSGGQMQRAAIARALINSPKLILADEPTGNLDSTNAQAILDMLCDIRDKKGSTIIIVTHDPAVAARADRIIELKDGAVL
jgi:ABC-type lipoprotein export system ATPase subunit